MKKANPPHAAPRGQPAPEGARHQDPRASIGRPGHASPFRRYRRQDALERRREVASESDAHLQDPSAPGAIINGRDRRVVRLGPERVGQSFIYDSRDARRTRGHGALKGRGNRRGPSDYWASMRSISRRYIEDVNKQFGAPRRSSILASLQPEIEFHVHGLAIMAE